MTAICKHTKLTAILCTVLAIFMMMSVLVVPAFAEEEEPSADESTTAATEPETSADTVDGTTADTTAGTTAGTTTGTTDGTTTGTTDGTTTGTTTETGKTEEQKKAERTRGIINLVVGAVILLALIVLGIVFRAKIPVWFKAIKSECGKIVWCPKDKLKKNSFVVIVIILILAVLIGLLDFAFSRGIILLGDLI